MVFLCCKCGFVYDILAHDNILLVDNCLCIYSYKVFVVDVPFKIFGIVLLNQIFLVGGGIVAKFNGIAAKDLNEFAMLWKVVFN